MKPLLPRPLPGSGGTTGRMIGHGHGHGHGHLTCGTSALPAGIGTRPADPRSGDVAGAVSAGRRCRLMFPSPRSPVVLPSVACADPDPAGSAAAGAVATMPTPPERTPAAIIPLTTVVRRRDRITSIPRLKAGASSARGL
jgi:hypothetical protein